MRFPSFWSSCRCAGLGVLVQGRYCGTFGGIRGEHWGGQVGSGGGCTACVGGVCVRGDWFPPVMSVAGKFLVFTHCFVGLLAGVDWFQCAFAWVVLWLAWALWGDLGCLLGSLCLVLSGMLAGTDG